MDVVWFKKDLRITDHGPLYAACRSGKAIMFLYVFEPDILNHPSFHGSHWVFLLESLEDLKAALQKYGAKLTIKTGSICEVLSNIHAEHKIEQIHAHEETGHGVSYQRDREVNGWCKSKGINFIEYPQTGVVRRLKTRDGWSQKWAKRMKENVLPSPIIADRCVHINSNGIPQKTIFNFSGEKRLEQQTGGRTEAIKTLNSFLERRGQRYQSAMSSPVSAWNQCSRLSPYISFGCLSMKEIHQSTKRMQDHWRQAETSNADPVRKEWLASLRSFSGRLRWHCHFIQKFEDEPSIEYQSIIERYDQLRQDANPELFQLWLEGRTGYPMVDACMRALQNSGWINFRMRAMLVSFAAYDLWQPWQKIAQALAPLFLDYEPGIHYSQIQMQSGVSGINTLRIYNPTKQCQDHDPEGVFIRKYLPELKDVPNEYLAEPWKMPNELQEKIGCQIEKNYPGPAVDHKLASKKARELVYEVRRKKETREAAKLVLEKHGSRRRRFQRTSS